MTTWLTKNFTLEEFTFSQTAIRRGIDNTPPSAVLPNIQATAEVLEEIRALLNCPIRITSGFRCGPLNRAVRGSKNSAHMRGKAADVVPRDYELLHAARLIEASGIQYDQLIYEFGSWIHVGVDKAMRRQSLTISAAGTVPGLQPVIRR